MFFLFHNSTRTLNLLLTFKHSSFICTLTIRWIEYMSLIWCDRNVHAFFSAHRYSLLKCVLPFHLVCIRLFLRVIYPMLLLLRVLLVQNSLCLLIWRNPKRIVLFWILILIELSWTWWLLSCHIKGIILNLHVGTVFRLLLMGDSRVNHVVWVGYRHLRLV